MKKRKLGNSGLEIAPLALGGNVFGWTADEPTSFRLLDAFTAAGGDLIVRRYLDDRGFRILEALDQVARRYRSAPATVALAWMIARPGITAPIASATSVDQLSELMKSLEIELDPSAIELLNRASA